MSAGQPFKVRSAASRRQNGRKSFSGKHLLADVPRAGGPAATAESVSTAASPEIASRRQGSANELIEGIETLRYHRFEQARGGPGGVAVGVDNVCACGAAATFDWNVDVSRAGISQWVRAVGESRLFLDGASAVSRRSEDVMRSAILAFLLVAVGPAPALAQPAARLSGRVVERGSDTGLAGAVIEIGRRRLSSNFEGRFDAADLSLGRHSVKISAYGYSPREVSLQLVADTSIVVELDPAPVALDPLLVEGRTISIRGEVYERGGDRGLLDVEVRVEPDHEAYSNSAGRFKLDDIPAGPPLRFSIRGFGYLPIESVLSAFEDTTLIIHLEVDPVAQRMIQQQVARLETRARPFSTAVMPAMDREYLLRNRNATALDLVHFRYGPFVRRINCILIDDQQSYNGLAELTHFLPEELERIEVFERGKMLRIYTRDYIRERLGEEGRLPMPVYVEYVDPPLCR